MSANADDYDLQNIECQRLPPSYERSPSFAKEQLRTLVTF